MKKLTLNVEDLAVKQFSTNAEQAQREGTVVATDASFWWSGRARVHTCRC